MTDEDEQPQNDIELLRELLTIGPQLAGSTITGGDINIAAYQDIRNVQAQDYVQGDAYKPTFNFITIYQSSMPQTFQEPAWEQVDWHEAEQRYKRELLRLYGTM